MKKKLILFLILIFISIFIYIPKYVELNNLAIIEGIGIKYGNNTYIVYLKEMIPIKDDLGINKKYKYYMVKSSSINTAFKDLKKKTKKKLYYKACSYIVTNKKISINMINKLSLNTKNIYHTKDVYNKLKRIN